MLSTRTGAALALAFLAGAAATQVARDRVQGEADVARELLYLESGRAVEKLALSYDAILADIYWIRAIQHFGGQRLQAPHTRRYDLLYPLLDIATTLDPYFNIAYRFGAIFLSEGYPDGPARPDLAVKLLEKAQKARPDRWQFAYDTAFIYYWWIHDYKAAADWFRRARQIPGSPEWLEGLAAITLARGQDREGSRHMWTQILQTAEHEYMRRTAEFRLVQLEAMDQIDQLNALLSRAATSGQRIHSWDEAVRARILRGIPVDPAGTPYVLDPASGRVAISPQSPFYPLPDEAPPPAERPAGQGRPHER